MTRKDLSFPQQAVQAIHAALESVYASSTPVSHPHLVLCQTRDEAHLRKTFRKITGKGVNLHPFYEPDLGNEMTAFASEITQDRRPFRSLQLLKEDTVMSLTQNAEKLELQANTINSKGAEVYVSPYGYYSLDRDTFRKLKELYSFAWKTWMEFVRYGRWARKEEQNRAKEAPIFDQRFLKEDRWWKQSMMLHPVRFEEEVMFHPAERLFQDGESGDYLTLNECETFNRIIVVFWESKMPKKSAEEVRKLRLSKEEIHQLHRNWISSV